MLYWFSGIRNKYRWIFFDKEVNTRVMKKNCNKCKKEFEAKEELDLFCSDECKQEALADLDSDSDECLSCQ